METQDLTFVPRQFSLDEWNEREYELAEKTEELESQKEELNAAIEELMSKNEYLSKTVNELSQRKNELDQLIYRLSHDLRTPVTSILGVCHLLKLEGIPSSFYYHLNHIQQKGYDLDTLLKSLSSFAQASFEPIQVADVSVPRLISSVLDVLRLEHKFQDIHISVKHTGNELAKLDENKIFSMVRNVLQNAVVFKCLDRQAIITVTTEVTDDTFIFTCHDNGIGIEENIKGKIFNMFYRGSERSTGSGLGLYAVNEIVRLMKGSIHVQSMPGDTSFIITIPLLSID